MPRRLGNCHFCKQIGGLLQGDSRPEGLNSPFRQANGKIDLSDRRWRQRRQYDHVSKRRGRHFRIVRHPCSSSGQLRNRRVLLTLETTALLRKVKLHENNLDDPLLLLQKFGIHLSSTRILLLYLGIWAIFLAFLADHPLQHDLYFLAGGVESSAVSRYLADSDQVNLPSAESRPALKTTTLFVLS